MSIQRPFKKKQEFKLGFLHKGEGHNNQSKSVGYLLMRGCSQMMSEAEW